MRYLVRGGVIPKLFDWIYPIGSVIANSNAAFDPNVIYKHQTWVRWAKGQTLVGVNEDDTDFAAVDKTGGEKKHTLTTAEMPKHTHKVNYQNVSRGSGSTTTRIPTDSALSGSATSGSSGSGAAHNNLQPYVTVFYWKRTA